MGNRKMLNGLTLRLVAVLVLVAGAAGAWLYIRALRAENETMTAAYSLAAQIAIDNKAAADAQAAEAKRLDGILAAREHLQRRIERENQQLSERVRAIAREKPVVRDWLNARVPDDIARLLNAETDHADRDPEDAAAGGANDRVQGAGDRDPH